MKWIENKLFWSKGNAPIWTKLKWWWCKHDIVCVWDELDGGRGNFYKKVPNKNWWEQAEYRKIK